MNKQFDELTIQMAQSVTRRAALKKFGFGLAGMALACFGLVNRSRGATWNGYCEVQQNWRGNKWVTTGICRGVDASGNCSIQTDYNACANGIVVGGSEKLGPCGYWSTKLPCSF